MRNIWKSMLVKVGTSIIPFSLECEKSQKGDRNTKIVFGKVLFEYWCPIEDATLFPTGILFCFLIYTIIICLCTV